MNKGRSLAVSAIVVTVATFLGRIVGFLREMVIANKFGASAQTDAFLVAFTIPNIIYSLAVMGALSASFIPVFSGLIANEKEKEAWRLAQTVLSLLLVGFGLVAIALVAFAPQVVFLAAPGFGASSQLVLGANLLRLMAPTLLFLGISGLMAGILNSYNHFAAPSLVALVQNVVVVGSIIVLAGRMGIYGAAVGLLVGSVGMVLIQIPVFIKKGFRIKPALSFSHENLADVGKLFVPVFFALAASQSNTVIDKWMASFLPGGSISYLNYAFKVGSLPLNTLIAAIAIVLFPTLSRHAATQDREALRETVSMGIRMIALVALPSSAVLFVLSFPITKLLFEHGAFSHSATLATAPTLAAYSFGLFAMGLSMLLVRVFYALKDGITPLKASVAFIAILIVLDTVFIRLFAHVGLAIGYVLASGFMVVILARALRRELSGIDEARILKALVKMIASALLMGVAIWLVSTQLEAVLGAGSKLHELAIVGASIVVGLGVYVAALTAMKAGEVMMVWKMLRAKISRSVPEAA